MNENLTRWMWIPNWKSIQNKSAVKAEFIRKFTCKKEELDIYKIIHKENKARIKISADSKYKLYVNDDLVCYGPARGDRQIWYYDEPDIIPYLHEGNNIIRIEVLYYQPFGANCNFGIAHGMNPALYFDADECKIHDLKDNLYDEEDVSLNGELLKWQCCIIPEFNVVREAEGFAPLMIMENIGIEQNVQYQVPVLYDAWQIFNEVSPGNLYKRPIPFMYLKKKILFNEKSEKFQIHAHETKKIVLDAGEEETGFFYIILSQKADIKILYSECYYLKDDQGHSYKGNRTDCESGHLEGFTDSCNAVCTYSPFWYRTFRYVEITIMALDKDVELKDIYYLETGYPLEVKHTYQGTDPYKKKIWNICLRTLKRCMQETYIDCPFYEQLQYVMDTRSQILYSYEVSEDDRLAREAIRSFARSQRYDGLLNAAYPSTASNVIPGFSIYFILMIEDHLNYFSDNVFIKPFLGNIDKILSFFDQNINEQGLISKIGGLNNPRDKYWSFIDWTKEWNATTGVPDAILKGPITMESLLYIIGLESAANINSKIGRKDTATEYKQRAENVRKAVRNHCLNRDGMITDGPGIDIVSQHCQVFGALCEILSMEVTKKNLEETMVHSAKYAQCSVAMMFYLFRALEKTGLYNMYAESKFKIYYWMLDNHLTTCVEDDVEQRSDCHGWGAFPLYEFLKYKEFY